MWLFVINALIFHVAVHYPQTVFVNYINVSSHVQVSATSVIKVRTIHGRIHHWNACRYSSRSCCLCWISKWVSMLAEDDMPTISHLRWDQSQLAWGRMVLNGIVSTLIPSRARIAPPTWVALPQSSVTRVNRNRERPKTQFTNHKPSIPIYLPPIITHLPTRQRFYGLLGLPSAPWKLSWRCESPWVRLLESDSWDWT